jgi:REP element-mobilizing transposase RayT
MVLGYHLIITTYGFWLPNDPRGSWSDFVASWELFRFGRATKTTARQSVAGAEHDWRSRLAAKSALKYPPVSFDGHQALAVANGFADAARDDGFRLWALAVLPEHVHAVIARHEQSIEWICKRMKRAGTRALLRAKRHPFEHHADEDGNVPMMWARGRWKVFLDSAADIRRAIRYVEDNPLKEDKRRQNWPFVEQYAPTV